MQAPQKPRLERLDSQHLQRSKRNFRQLDIVAIDNNNNLSDSSSSKSDDDDDDDDENNGHERNQFMSAYNESGEKSNDASNHDFNFKQFDNLDSSLFPADLKEIMQYVPKFSPSHIDIDYKLQVFIPEFIPSVGDIDACLKIVTPEALDSFDVNQLKEIKKLGLDVLDEPGEQSEEPLLQMKLRYTLSKSLAAPSALAKSPKDIDKWIHEIQSLHASRIHENLMQHHQTHVNIDNLMTEWPADIERRLESTYPSASLNCQLSDYVQIICNLFDIPIENAENHYDYIRALNVLFNLFIAVKAS